MNLIKEAVQEFGLFFLVFSLIAFVTSFAIRWLQTASISNGHKLIGLGTLVSLILLLLVVAFDHVHAYIIAPFAILGLTAWVGYNDWYFYRYPGLSTWLDEPKRPVGTFGANTWLGRFLTKQEDGEDDKEGRFERQALLSWKGGFWLMAAFVVLALCFGFARKIDGLTRSYHWFMKTQAINTQQTKQAINSAVQQNVAPLTSQIASLSVSQTQLVSDVKSSNASVAAGVRTEMAAAKKETKKATNAANNAYRRNNSFFVVPPQPIKTVPNFIVPADKVKPLPAPRTPNKVRQGKYGFRLDEANDLPFSAPAGRRNWDMDVTQSDFTRQDSIGGIPR